MIWQNGPVFIGPFLRAKNLYFVLFCSQNGTKLNQDFSCLLAANVYPMARQAGG